MWCILDQEKIYVMYVQEVIYSFFFLFSVWKLTKLLGHTVQLRCALVLQGHYGAKLEEILIFSHPMSVDGQFYFFFSRVCMCHGYLSSWLDASYFLLDGNPGHVAHA